MFIFIEIKLSIAGTGIMTGVRLQVF